MAESTDNPEHPLLEGHYIGFVRTESDGDVEVNTPFLIRLVSGKVQIIFSFEGDIQCMETDRVSEEFKQCLERLKIGEITTPLFIPPEGFLGTPSFLNIDKKLGIGSCYPDPESSHFEGDEIIHWVRYISFGSMESGDWGNFLKEMSIVVKKYDVERGSFLE